MTSSLPNRLYGDGFRRHGFDADTTWYFDEHVEADAVHEQIAGRDLAGALAEQEPELLDDILFGAAACLHLDDLVGDARARRLDGRDVVPAGPHERRPTRPAGPPASGATHAASIVACPDGPILVRGDVDDRRRRGTAGAAPTRDGRAVPLRRLDDQAVLRRHAQGDRVHGTVMPSERRASPQ